MSDKRELDETDAAIVQLLADDARRPFSEIAEHVGLSPPAVSDRVDRLQEQGIIRQFTVDIDRQKLRSRMPVLITFEAEPTHTAELYRSLRGLDGVEHVFKTHDGTVVAYANAPDSGLDTWVRDGVDLEHVVGFDIDLIDQYDWSMSIDTAEFALPCPVCGNATGNDGVTADVGGEIKTFCCPSCRADYEQEYASYQSNV